MSQGLVAGEAIKQASAAGGFEFIGSAAQAFVGRVPGPGRRAKPQANAIVMAYHGFGTAVFCPIATGLILR